jgi:multiple sugar transport system substrate-binding protein
MSHLASRRLSRREMLALLGTGSAGLALAACQPKIVEVTKEVPVEVPVEQTVVVEKTVVVEQEVVVEPTAVLPLEEGELKLLLCCSGTADIENRNRWNIGWEAAHPGIKIVQDTLPAGQNYFEKLQTLIAAGTMPDLFDMWEGYIQPYAANGVLLDLEPFLEADPLIGREDLVPAAVDVASYQGRIYSLLQSFFPGPGSLYFNPAHFDEVGLEYPTADWTWDDVREAAAALNNPPNRWGLTYSLWFVPWLYWIWSNGGDLFNEDETKCALTEPPAYEALQYWADMVLVDKTTLPSAESQAMQGPENAFQTGMVSMYLGNFWDVPGFEAATESSGFNWKAVLSPKAPNGNRIWYEHLTCWSIWTGTKKPNASWVYARDFVLDGVILQAYFGIPPLFKLLPTVDTEHNRNLGYTPLIELATKPDVLRWPGAGEKFDKISQLVQAELDLVWIGEKTAKQAAEDVCPEVDAVLAGE